MSSALFLIPEILILRPGVVYQLPEDGQTHVIDDSTSGSDFLLAKSNQWRLSHIFSTDKWDSLYYSYHYPYYSLRSLQMDRFTSLQDFKRQSMNCKYTEGAAERRVNDKKLECV